MADRLPDVPMKAITVRMGQDVHSQVSAAAAAEGVSVSQYLRESALARVWFSHGYRQDESAVVARAMLALTRAAEAEGVAVDVYVQRLLGPWECEKPPAPSA